MTGVNSTDTSDNLGSSSGGKHVVSRISYRQAGGRDRLSFGEEDNRRVLLQVFVVSHLHPVLASVFPMKAGAVTGDEVDDKRRMTPSTRTLQSEIQPVSHLPFKDYLSNCHCACVSGRFVASANF